MPHRRRQRARGHRPTELGFVVTPGEIKGRAQAVEAQVRALLGDVQASSAPRLDAKWREAFNGFVRRWRVFYGSLSDVTGRMFNYRVEPRLEDMEAALARWQTDFHSRTGKSASLPDAAELRDLGDDVLDRIQKGADTFTAGISGAAVGVLACLGLVGLIAWKR